MEAKCLRPMFLGVKYRVETSGKEGLWEVRLFDGSTPVVSLTVTAKIAHGHEAPEELGAAPVFERREAAVRQQESIFEGLTVSGAYGCNAAALATLAARWGDVDRLSAAMLCWGSYLVGMELPGESALFSRLVLRFHEEAPFSAPMTYRASVVSVDSRFGLIETDVSLLNGGSTVVSGQCWSYIRSPEPEVEEIDSTGVRPDSLAGRVAVILGSSRGLGAAMKRALDLRGAAVYGMARSGKTGDLSRTEVGDAADPEAVRRLRERVFREHGRLDFLICNACPPALPLRLEANAADRIGAYIHQAVSLTLTPLCEFLELLNQSNGCAVVISSIFVEHPVREFPHYIAAKGAVEALVRVASLRYPRVASLIVRPPKLLTAMTNTPMGRLGAAPPESLASRIAARLEDPLEPGKAEILG
jgi:NAD(P)-dependent dehydrogenase (short-subunit alcohol dehydrogenase family)